MTTTHQCIASFFFRLSVSSAYLPFVWSVSVKKTEAVMHMLTRIDHLKKLKTGMGLGKRLPQ